MLEVLLDNKNGFIWDISDMVSEVSWKTSRIGKAGSLDLTLTKGGNNPNFAYHNGDIIRVSYRDTPVFFGYVFSISDGKSETVTLSCYDQIRYLLTNDVVIMTNVTATQLVRKLAADLDLTVGQLEDTGHRLSLAEEDKTLLDVICHALDLTLIQTTNHFILYDDFGQLMLRNIREMKTDLVIGDDSLLYDYTLESSIDDDTFNQIKVIQDNKTTGQREKYLDQDSTTIARWGRLQLLHKADEKMNLAQLNQLLDMLMTLKNREQKKLQLQAVGDLRIRAGSFVPVVIEQAGLSEYFLVDECSHNWKGSDYTMTLDLKVV